MNSIVRIGISICVVFLAGVANGQVVQLPSYRVFQMPLNVVVPDGGTAFAGGTSYASDVRSTRGFLPRRDFRSSRRGSNSVFVSATIIDHRELDAAVLAEAARMRGEPVTNADRNRIQDMQDQILADRDRRIHPEPVNTEAATLAENHDDSLDLIRRGDSSLAQGQTGAARIFFRTAYRQSRGPTRQAAARRLRELAQSD